MDHFVAVVDDDALVTRTHERAVERIGRVVRFEHEPRREGVHEAACASPADVDGREALHLRTRKP